MQFKAEFILLVILSILDAATTIYFLEFTHLIEGNPLVAFLLEHTGYLGALVISKAGVLGIFAYILNKEEVKDSKFVKYGMWFIITYYIFVVTWNIIGII